MTRLRSAEAPMRARGGGGFAARWSRRALTIPLLVALAAVALGAAPLLLALAALADCVRGGPWVLVRCLLFFQWYLLCEVVGVVAAGLAWLLSGVWAGASRARLLAWNLALQALWGTALYRGAERIFAMRTIVEEGPAPVGGPFLVLIRHASTADTVLPVVFLTRAHGLALRYVLKRELLWDPCLDIVGNRLPNYFVDRSSRDTEREVAGVRGLMDGLGPREGVLIYPEGTRFTPAKQRRALARLVGNPPLAARAATLRHVLPPRLGGPLALLDAAAGEADVLVLAHVGLEGAASFWELVNGSLVGTTVRLSWWRIPGAEIPLDAEARVAWLYAQWQRVDAWIADARGREHADARATSTAA